MRQGSGVTVAGCAVTPGEVRASGRSPRFLELSTGVTGPSPFASTTSVAPTVPRRAFTLRVEPEPSFDDTLTP